MDDIDVRNRMRADKRKGVKKDLSKYRKNVQSSIRYTFDKRKDGVNGPNKYRKLAKCVVKGKSKQETLVVVEEKVIKTRKKRVETKPRKTKYSHFTTEEKKIAYRSSKEKRKEMYAKHIEKHREERKNYYYANKEKILEQQRQRRREKAIAEGRGGDTPQIGRPRKY